MLSQKILNFSKWLKLVIVVVGFLVIVVIQGINIPSSQPEIKYYGFNEDFLLTYKSNNFSMVIYNITKEKSMSIDGEEKTTTGVFLRINGGVTNMGIAGSPDFSAYTGLEDNQNNSYQLLGYNFGVGPFQPNLKKDFFYVFEIPKEAAGLKFSVSSDKHIFYVIDLGI